MALIGIAVFLAFACLKNLAIGTLIPFAVHAVHDLAGSFGAERMISGVWDTQLTGAAMLFA